MGRSPVSGSASRTRTRIQEGGSFEPCSCFRIVDIDPGPWGARTRMGAGAGGSCGGGAAVGGAAAGITGGATSIPQTAPGPQHTHRQHT